MNASATSFPISDKKASHYLHWFRRDLRTHDNTALAHAVSQARESQGKVSAVFILTPQQWLEHDMSLVQVDFILRTLAVLQRDLTRQFGIKMHILDSSNFADGVNTLSDFCQSHDITEVTANIEYEVNEVARDELATATLHELGITFERHHDQCILPPDSVTTNDGNMYQVFTPFYKKWQSLLETSPPKLHPLTLLKQKVDADWLTDAQDRLDELSQQVIKDYAIKQNCQTDEALSYCRANYRAGETEAKHRLDQFIADDIKQYDIARDRPADDATSRLSAYLTIGAISPRYCYLQATRALQASPDDGKDVSRWISELAWRDFYRHVIANRPDIVKGNAYKTDTDKRVNWAYDEADFKQWCEGKTGVPLVDAAMRYLKETGFMHNRLRMVTAMFLTKDLLIDWRWGERYFMQTLIDGDFASNNGGWQWSASVGTDSAPYFRIMNPFSQAKSHDKNAFFIKTCLPELKSIPSSVLHDESKLRYALSEDGKFSHVDYPLPMVDHKQARQLAIAEFKAN